MISNTESVRRYQAEKVDTIVVRPAKGTKERWKAAADLDRVSLQRFVVLAVEKYISDQESGSVTHR